MGWQVASDPWRWPALKHWPNISDELCTKYRLHLHMLHLQLLHSFFQPVTTIMQVPTPLHIIETHPYLPGVCMSPAASTPASILGCAVSQLSTQWRHGTQRLHYTSMLGLTCWWFCNLYASSEHNATPAGVSASLAAR